MKQILTICFLCAALMLAINTQGQPAIQIATGPIDSLFLKSDGSLWTMGNNDYGQLGDGTYTSTNLPQKIVATNITAIAVGYDHSLFISNNSSLWAMGYDFYGQLGETNHAAPYTTSYTTNLPELIVASNVTAIAAGDYHSLFISNNGSLWGMGDNSDGELSTNASYNQPVPALIITNGVAKIAAGFYFSFFIRTNGSLWALGENNDGQLGVETDPSTYTQIPLQVAASNITAIAAGDDHSLFISNNGSLWGMGLNTSGQLGDNTYVNTNLPVEIVASNVTAVAAGSLHSLFLKSDGSLWGMGDNGYGQLGNNYNYGTNQPELIVPNGVTAIAAGGYHSLFLKSDGSVWVMGDNVYGELGNGNNNSVYFPQSILTTVNYNLLYVSLLANGDARLSYSGVAETLYALDRTFNLAPSDWVPQATNATGADGGLIFTNTPNPATNNFWRVRSVP